MSHSKGKEPYESVLDSIIHDKTYSNRHSDAPDVHIAIQEPTVPESKNDELQNKLDIMVLTRGWNNRNEQIVISIGENAASYKWMHEKSASYYKIISKCINIVMIVLSTALSAETIIKNDTTNVAISIVRQTITYVLTLFTVLNSFLRYEKLSEQHLSAALSFSHLYHDIQQQMCMYRRHRQTATEYVGNILKQYDNLVVSSPDINQHVVRQFKNTFKNEVTVPDIADRLQKIETITETPPLPPPPSPPKDDIAQPITPTQIPRTRPRKTQTPAQSVANARPGIEFNDLPSRRFGRYGLNNLNQIHNAFQIQGDITDADIQNANSVELERLRKKYFVGRSDFEYQRFREHAREFD